MLHLVQSNKMESLAAYLIGWLGESKSTLTNVFSPDVVLVQSPGMAQWLKIEIGQALGIAANIDFPLPSSYIWQLYKGHVNDLPEQSAFTKDNMTWKLMSILPAMSDRDEFASIVQYLNDNQPLKLYQLCQKIADIYDQYLVYRPEWILTWEKGENALPDTDVASQPWQPILWRALVDFAKELDESPYHRANLHQRLLSELEQASSQSTEQKPLFVFGLSAMPVQQLEIFAALAKSRDVIIFWFNPSAHYWGDIVDNKQVLQAKLHNLLKQANDESNGGINGMDDYLLVGNPLLASWGKQGRDYQDMILGLDVEQHEAFIEQEPESLLGHIQHEVLALTHRGSSEPLSAQELLSNGSLYPKIAIEHHDTSFQVHACHSGVRELEILHDQLLHLFAQDPELHPGDVIVMMPDVATYAPIIDGVFGGTEKALSIPYAISDRNAQQESPLLNSFIQLMSLHQSRIALSDVLALCEVPAIQRKFDITPDEFELLSVWLADAGVRWGWDGDDKSRWALPRESQNTWLFGLQRLLAGYAMGGQGMFDDSSQLIAPYEHIEGQHVIALGKFYMFSRELGKALTFCQSKGSLKSKITEALELIENTYLPDDDDQSYLLQLRQSIEQMSMHQCQYDGEIVHDVFFAELEQNLSSKGVGQRFLAGYVNFCTLMPMRSVPFKVVCLLGLNDGDYPRQVVPVGFDLMRIGKGRRGDRSRRLDDRYLFLEAILSARKRLYLSFQGFSAKDNSARTPSILLSELLEYAEQTFCLAGDERLTPQACGQNLYQHIYHVHALQPFNPKYFDVEDAQSTLNKGGASPTQPSLQRSFQTHWLALAQQLAEGHLVSDKPMDFCPNPLSPLPDLAQTTDVELDELLQFFSNPAKAFFTQRWQTRLTRIYDVQSDDEPFELDALSRYMLNERFVTTQQDDWTARLRAEGRLPTGNIADISLQPIRKQSQALIDAIAAVIGGSLEEVSAKRTEVNFALSYMLEGGQSNDDISAIQTEQVSVLSQAIQITGWVDNLYNGNLVFWRPGKVKGNNITQLWLTWLALCANGTVANDKRAYFIGIDDKEPFSISAIDMYEAKTQLAIFIRYWRIGLQQVLHFYPKTAYEWLSGSDEKKALLKAQNMFYGSYFAKGEGDEPHIRRVCPDLAEHFDAFGHVSHALLGPLFDSIEAES
ncbi:exodeoxyribonuclease V subunit gamma [uncultured Paraglaciecola sp.]|uniref:exodeoxyribonuclease V subunit gamma n=1 Tax=uncultured Paraglaciecola sp. TaxID=1765024 RepID=UPI0030D7736C|tara:strand:- start:48294 stop:51794 length:3501 start_codon:yes stop_codon:yes gene_type:complete